MKIHKYQFCTFLIALFLLLIPLQTEAAYKPQAVPAEGITTTLSDSRFIDPSFITHKVVLSWQGNDWIMGMDALRDMPITLTYANGSMTVSFPDTSVLKAYLGAVNVKLADLAAVSSDVLYQNESGTFITRTGKSYFQLNEHVEAWLSIYLSQMAASNNWSDIEQELNEHFLIQVTDDASYSLSDDYMIAGTCTTSYKSSGKNRSNNVQVAASRVNNMVVMPGQTVSISTTILPRTAANGYLPSDVYQNGKTVTGYGGGICQVSSTVYNAVMNAGVTVVERKPHSMPISYLPQGMDAAIASGYKDMRFKNNYDVPIYLTAVTQNKTLTVNVYVPKATMGGKSYKLWAEQTSDLSAKTYLTTYQDGKEVSTKYIGSSSYLPYKGLGED